MKLIIFLFFCVFITKVSAQGLTKNGQYANSSTSFVDRNGKLGTNPTLTMNGKKVWLCGTPLTINHVSGDGVAAETKSIDYGTVLTTLSGSSQCWITQNLGATNQATIVTDNTEAAAGWYFQFNRKQGYKHDGTTLSPATPVWPSSGDASNLNWQPANDPCTLSLGAGWRIPSDGEFDLVSANANWVGYNEAFSSVLKIHNAGYVLGSKALSNRGTGGYYSVSQLYTNSSYVYIMQFNVALARRSMQMTKAQGYPIRCLKDNDPFVCGNTFVVNHLASGGVAPVDKTVTYGTVRTSLTGISQCWITQNLGADHQALSATDNTEASAGWYFQYGRKQGFKHDGTTQTPNTWNGANDAALIWVTSKDPCALELGVGWRIPTQSEMLNADFTGSWTNLTDTYNSVLKLHAAGYLYNLVLYNSGTSGSFWTGTGTDVNTAQLFGFGASAAVSNDYKYNGRTQRCLHQ